MLLAAAEQETTKSMTKVVLLRNSSVSMSSGGARSRARGTKEEVSIRLQLDLAGTHT